ncbi:MAG: hypothetical protein AAF664_23990, partial [Planctomycetota bacterium]
MISLEIPDSRAEQIEWLEVRLVSPDFQDWVDELVVLRANSLPLDHQEPSATSTPSLEEERFHVLCKEGLASLTKEELSSLLRAPNELSALQFRVFESGSAYWSKLITTHGGKPTKTIDALESIPIASIKREATQSREINLRWLIGFVAIAASLLFAVIANQRNQEPDQESQQVAKLIPEAINDGWGWQLEEERLAIADANQYVDWLIDGAEAWFNRDTVTAEEFEVRLVELQDGCQSLIDGAHPAFSTAQRDFLVARCREWQAKFQAHFNELIVAPENFQLIKR